MSAEQIEMLQIGLGSICLIIAYRIGVWLENENQKRKDKDEMETS